MKIISKNTDIINLKDKEPQETPTEKNLILDLESMKKRVDTDNLVSFRPKTDDKSEKNEND